MLTIRLCSLSGRQPVRLATTRNTIQSVRNYHSSPVLNNRYGDDYYGQTRNNRFEFNNNNNNNKRGQTELNFEGGLGDDEVLPARKLKFEPKVKRSEEEISEWRKTSGISVTGNLECPDPILTFEEAPFGAAASTLKHLYSEPLPIQSQGWSVALSGTNMVGCADTGSGKTVAFLLPAFEHIKLQGRKRHGAAALVLAPTRELALQIEEEARKFNRAYGCNVACLFGGANNRRDQLRQLYSNPGLIIATPGRLLDFSSMGNVDLSGISFLVLDEADRMLDMGFERDIRAILPQIAPEHQTCMWTATWPKSVARLASDFFPNYVRVNVGSDDLTANPNVLQLVEVLPPSEKNRRVLKILKENPKAKILIFVETKAGCDFLGEYLYGNGIEVAGMHGDKSQMQRTAVISDFKKDILKIVIATDVAARGLDVNNIDLVINFDFPNNIESYIHRIGRTARAGKKGTAVSFFTNMNFHLIEDLLDVMKGSGQNIPTELNRILEKEDEIRIAKQEATKIQNSRKQRLGGASRSSYGGSSSSGVPGGRNSHFGFGESSKTKKETFGFGRGDSKRDYEGFGGSSSRNNFDTKRSSGRDFNW